MIEPKRHDVLVKCCQEDYEHYDKSEASEVIINNLLQHIAYLTEQVREGREIGVMLEGFLKNPRGDDSKRVKKFLNETEGVMSVSEDQSLSRIAETCKSYFPDLFERPDYNGKFYRLAAELREQWEQETYAILGEIGEKNVTLQQSRLVPVAGAPDLEGVDEKYLYLVTPYNETQVMFQWIMATAADLRADRRAYQWHIPLGVITPPEPEMPKCPWCGGSLILKHAVHNGYASGKCHWLQCYNEECEAVMPTRNTEAGAIEAARGRSE